MKKSTTEENMIAAMLPGGIEAQEARGQTEFVNSEVLPKDMLHGCTKEKLEKVGIKLLGEHDDIFVNVALPNGWEKKPTDHNMWSNLVDDRGRVRANIFYKAAFYDRSAHVSLTKRFNIAWDYDNNFAKVMDGNKEIFRAGPPNKDHDEWQERDRLREKAMEWLREIRPLWEDETEYWGDQE